MIEIVAPVLFVTLGVWLSVEMYKDWRSYMRRKKNHEKGEFIQWL